MTIHRTAPTPLRGVYTKIRLQIGLQYWTPILKAGGGSGIDYRVALGLVSRNVVAHVADRSRADVLLAAVVAGGRKIEDSHADC